MKFIGLIDTNILLRSVVGDVPQEAQAADLLLNQIAQGDVAGLVPITVVLEFVFVLERTYSVPRADVTGAIRDMIAIANLDVEHAEVVLDCLNDYLSGAGISFPDAFHCALARARYEGAIVSFDRKLSGISGVNLIEPTPT